MRSTTSESWPRVLCARSRRAHSIADETVVKSITGATTGISALLAAMNGACATIPVGPMTAVPTPVPMVISVAGLAVARKTLPASSDDAAVLPAPSVGSSHVLSMTPPDWRGWSSDHDARNASLASRPRSTKAIERPS